MNVTIGSLCIEACQIVFSDQATPSTADQTTALACLVAALDTFSADPTKIFTSSIVSYTLTPNKYVYTIGADASRDFNIARPQAIRIANLIDLSVAAYPIRNPMEILDDAGWAAIRLQNTPTPIPTKLYYDGGDSQIGSTQYGYGTIYLNGIPSAANKVELYLESLLTTYSSLSDQVVLPPAYYEALLYATVRRLSVRFARPLDATVLQLESDALAKLEARNLDTPRMSLDGGLPRQRPAYYDYRTNQQL